MRKGETNARGRKMKPKFITINKAKKKKKRKKNEGEGIKDGMNAICHEYSTERGDNGIHPVEGWMFRF